MNRVRRLAIGTLAFISPAAIAQTFVEPTFYMWGNHRPLDLEPGTYSNLVSMVSIDAYGHGMPNSGTIASQTPSPQLAAWVAAQEILARKYTGSYQHPPGTTHAHTVADLTDDKVCLTFFGLGRDQADCDGNETAGPSRQLSSLRFFREEDRLPGMKDWDGETPTPEFDGFPIQTNSNGLDPSPNRTYRHPFLINAGRVAALDSSHGCHHPTVALHGRVVSSDGA